MEGVVMRWVPLCGVIIFGFLGSSQVALAAPPPGFSEVITHCESCHGSKGESSTPSIPRLNGQSADYLLLRLREFSDPTSQSSHAFDNMWPVVTAMNDDSKKQIAEYFAQQTPPSITLTGPASGKKLYEEGLHAQSVAACASCHGSNAEGGPSAPRLAGQQLEYLKTQLWDFNFVTRVHGPMNARAMKFMSEDIDALASYLAGR